MEFDLHLHTIASGHGTLCTITDMAKAASEKGLKIIGISDHGPASAAAARSAYFRGLSQAPRHRFGIELLYGAELNILDTEGNVDLDDSILSQLDYAIISMHIPTCKPQTKAENTNAYIKAMNHPNVRFIGHPDDTRFPVDYDKLLEAAVKHQVMLEINNRSLAPDSYRGDTRSNIAAILNLSKQYQYPLLLSSDSHGTEQLGDFRYILEILHQTDFPEHLILNHSAEKLKTFLYPKTDA